MQADIYNIDKVQREIKKKVKNIEKQYLLYENRSNDITSHFTKEEIEIIFNSLISQQTKFFEDPDKKEDPINKGQVYFY